MLLLIAALLVTCFGMAAHLVPQFQGWRGSRSTGDVFNIALGDSRQMFANSFYVKADEYYHSGYYPTIFDDNTAFKTAHMAEDTGAVTTKNHGDEHGFLGPTRNWIDALGRNFFPDHHTHLDEGGPGDDLSTSQDVREILPWLKLSADLDPDNVQTYTVTAFWLRERMNNVREADAVLHEGLRNCPGSYDILFELGRLYYESYKDPARARNVWEEGARRWLMLNNEEWQKLNSDPQGRPPITKIIAAWIALPLDLNDLQKDNQLVMEQLTTHLGKVAEDEGNLPEAIQWFEAAQKVSETPDVIQKQINDLKYKLGQELNPVLKPLY